MTRASFLIAAAFLLSCRTQKTVENDVEVSVDSIAHSATHRTFFELDSVVSFAEFDFDTLHVTFERPLADVPQTIKIKAIGGKISRSKEQHKFAAEEYGRLDTLAYKRSASEQTAEHSASVRIYDPPNTTALIIAGLLIIGAAVYLIFRRKI